MPTDQTVNASQVQPVPTLEPQLPNPLLTDDSIKSHPLYKDLEKKHADARKGLDEKAIELKKFKKALLEDEVVPVATKPAEPVTTDNISKLKDELLWEVKNEQKIALVKAEYEQNMNDGFPRDKALEYALLKGGFSSDKAVMEQLRLQSSSSPGSSVDRTSETSQESDEMKNYRKTHGISEEMWKKWGPVVANHKHKWFGFK